MKLHSKKIFQVATFLDRIANGDTVVPVERGEVMVYAGLLHAYADELEKQERAPKLPAIHWPRVVQFNGTDWVRVTYEEDGDSFLFYRHTIPEASTPAPAVTPTAPPAEETTLTDLFSVLRENMAFQHEENAAQTRALSTIALAFETFNRQHKASHDSTRQLFEALLTRLDMIAVPLRAIADKHGS